MAVAGAKLSSKVSTGRYPCDVSTMRRASSNVRAQDEAAAVKDLAGWRQGKRAVVPVEQPHAERGFEFPDLLRNR